MLSHDDRDRVQEDIIGLCKNIVIEMSTNENLSVPRKKKNFESSATLSELNDYVSSGSEDEEIVSAEIKVKKYMAGSYKVNYETFPTKTVFR